MDGGLKVIHKDYWRYFSEPLHHKKTKLNIQLCRVFCTAGLGFFAENNYIIGC